MADNRYGGYGRREGWRGRDDSIFSDDDRFERGSGRWSSDYRRDRGGGDDDRGFFERAGDELRSWFGDEEAERRREMDMKRDEGRGALGGRGFDSRFEAGATSGARSFYGSGSSSFGDRSEPGGASFARDRGGQRGFGGARSHWDDNYRQWRDRQIQQFDSEYEDYCRERQQQFEQDFDSWRGSRLTQGGTSGQFGGASSGETLQTPAAGGGQSGASSRNQSGATGTSGALGAETAATGSAMESSTGGSGGGRGGRSRA